MDKSLSLQELYTIYKKWVITNPGLVTDVETVATWSSYFVAGKINKSPIVSELVYSISKLASLFNDRLIRDAYGAGDPFYGLKDQIKLWLTVIHYCEVFIELLVKNRWGSRGKWTVTTILQVFKCSSALVLLFRFKELPLSHPPVAALQRRKLTEGKETDENFNSSFTLRRCGRIIRRVDGSPAVAFRDWVPMKLKVDRPDTDNTVNDLVYAESLHILRPLIHLAAMKMFGTKAWKQWLVALGVDLASIKLYGKNLKDLSNEQRLEISRRKLSLVLYLLRSPVYNGFSKIMIETTLTSMTEKVPALSFICGPIIQYLSHWQDIYFYMWSS